MPYSNWYCVSEPRTITPVSVAVVSDTRVAGVVRASGVESACAAGAGAAAIARTRAAGRTRASMGTSWLIGESELRLELGGVAGQVAVAGADEDGLVTTGVAHLDRALRDARQRAGAGLLGEPARATHGRDAVAPATAEAAVLVLRPQPGGLGLGRRAAGAEREARDASERGGGRRAAGRATALEEDLGQAARAARLADLEDGAPERGGLRAAARDSGLQRETALAGVDDRARWDRAGAGERDVPRAVRETDLQVPRDRRDRHRPAEHGPRARPDRGRRTAGRVLLRQAGRRRRGGGVVLRLAGRRARGGARHGRRGRYRRGRRRLVGPAGRDPAAAVVAAARAGLARRGGRRDGGEEQDERGDERARDELCDDPHGPEIGRLAADVKLRTARADACRRANAPGRGRAGRPAPPPPNDHERSRRRARGFRGAVAPGAQPEVRARYAWPARTVTVRPARRSRTSTAPCMTRVTVPAQVSRVDQRVPRTVATLLRPLVRKRPWLSRAHRAPGLGLRAVTAAMRAPAPEREALHEAGGPLRSTRSVTPLPVVDWRTSKTAPRTVAV